MLNVKKWWSMLCPAPGPHPAGEKVPAATHHAELDYWWLLPGDVVLALPAGDPTVAEG